MTQKHTLTPILTERFDAAVAYARRHHDRQLRKGTAVPYTAHLLAVAAIVLEMGGTEDEAIGALLHDVVEDGGGATAEAEIRDRFGADVVRIVRANSDTDVEPKPPWRARKSAYIAAIAHKRPDELRVSLADKLHNLRSVVEDFRVVGPALWDRFNPEADTPWYYEQLTAAFGRRAADLGPGALPALNQLRGLCLELEELVADAEA